MTQVKARQTHARGSNKPAHMQGFSKTSIDSNSVGSTVKEAHCHQRFHSLEPRMRTIQVI